MNSKIGIIIGREFKERVAKKSFIITTILMPVLMLAMMVAPALIMNLSSPSQRTLAVSDQSGVVMPALIDAHLENVSLVPMTEPLDSAMRNEGYDGILVVDKDVVSRPAATLYMQDAGSLEFEASISSVIEDAVRDQRLQSYDIANLDEILKEVEPEVNLSTVRITEEGEESTSSALALGIGMVSAFILYMFLLMYGQAVMTSIIEEKSNRVLELVVSSVKPTQLMLGKIFGVGLVAVVQVAIWGILMAAISALIIPFVMPETAMSQVQMINAGTFNPDTATYDTDLLQMLAYFGSVTKILALFGYLILFLIGGFLFYASIFAAIGSSVDNVQDASQLTSFAIIPIIVGLVFSMTVAQDPNTSLAFWMSIVPFTSPMVMLCRIPYSIPFWEIALSLVVLYLSFIFLAWLAGKIYRVGIFMYGKKPNIKDLYRWARYK